MVTSSTPRFHQVCLLVVCIFTLLLVRTFGDVEEEAKTDCEACKFYPSVCDDIDGCIRDCNIAPTMKDNCNDLINQANSAGVRNDGSL
jgi:hypothetical protein